MSPANRPSKQRRAADNRASRQALAARRENATQRAADAVRAVEPTRGRQRTRGSREAAAGGGAARRPGLLGGLLGGSAGGARRAPMDIPVDPDDTTGRRAALFAIFAAIAATIGLSLFPIPVGDDGEPLTREEQDDDSIEESSDPAIQAVGPVIFIYGLPMVGVTGFSLYSLRKPRRSRALLVCLVAAGVFVLLNAAIGILFVPAAIAIGVARLQIKRKEIAELAAMAPVEPRGAADDDDVIEAEVVDDDEIIEDEHDDEYDDEGSDETEAQRKD